MTEDQKKAFMEVTELVKDCTKDFAEISRRCTARVKNIEQRLSFVKDLIDQPKPKEGE